MQFPTIISQDYRMVKVFELMDAVASARATVLLCGESGTGKSHYSRVIHDLSARRNGPFVEVGLTSDVGSDDLIQSDLFGHVRGAFTGAAEEKQGLLSLADGGTLFLDEIGDASPELQARLLRVIENKTFKMLGGVRDIAVNVRILTATNHDLAAMAREGRFREDLFCRLNVIRIDMPPLRERAEDAPGLVQHLFEKVCREAHKPDKLLADEAFRMLCSYHWPGNIRELENALRHAVGFSEDAVVGPNDLPEVPRSEATTQHMPAAPPTPTAEVIDRDALRQTLSTLAPRPGAQSFEWPGHIDYAKREYLRALIEHHHGDLREIAKHWDGSSESTLLKLIRDFALGEELRAARRERK